MKYAATLPLTALFALSLIFALIGLEIIPDGYRLLETLNTRFGEYFFVMVFTIILLESIVYIGFYFPGQFFAVLLVVLSQPSHTDVWLLTVCMVSAATLGSAANYVLGRCFSQQQAHQSHASVKHLLMAMVHINALAFFMFNQGARRNNPSVILLAGALNLPYYLVLILITATLSDEIMHVVENNWLVFGLVSIWLLIALVYDVKKRLDKQKLPQS